MIDPHEPHAGEICYRCKEEFTMAEWEDRHQEDKGTDLFPDVVNCHADCCSSCNWRYV